MQKELGLGIVLGLLVFLTGLAQPVAPPAQAEGPSFRLGLGAKLVSGIPFAVGAVQYGALGADVGAGIGSQDVRGTNVTLFWYDVLAKYLFTLPWDFLKPYIGGGAIGLGASAPVQIEGMPVTVTISALGGHLTSGVELRFGNLAVFLGGDFLLLTEMKITAAGISLSAPIAYGGLGYHIGVRYDF